MDSPNKLLKLKYCNKHNLPIILFDADPKERGNCLICIKYKTGMMSLETYQQQLNDIINLADEQCNQDIQQFQNWHLSISNYKCSLVQSLDKILKIMMEKIEIIGKFRQKLKQLSLSKIDEQKAVDNFYQECQHLYQENELFRQQIRQRLQNFQSKYFNNLDQFVFQLNQTLIVKDVSLDQRILQYELIKESSKQENNFCFAFAFNKNNNILAVGCGKEIIVYKFKKGVIGKEFQRLTIHTESIACLQFMNKSYCIISGSYDCLIIIWEYNQGKNQYFAKQILKDHTRQINCILLSKDDDLLISCSNDQTIKFWSKINNSWSCIQTIKTQVEGISLNELEDKLISCVSTQKIISVMKKGSDHQWSIVQQININSSGTRLCFTIGDQFTFKPKGDQLEVYNYNKKVQKFEIINNIKLQYQENNKLLFPCQYIKEKQLLSVRYGPNLNMFKVNQEGNYQLIQQIQFKSDCLYGRLTDDGKYLATWDLEFKEIQIRELKYQQ